MKRFDHRARVSASLNNRTLDTIGKLQAFKCSAWGSSYHAGTVYQALTGAGLAYLSSDVVDEPGVGWYIDPATQPSWTIGYGQIINAYENASVYRRDNPITPNVTGAQLLLNGSGLKSPPVVFDTGAGPVYSDRLRTAPYDEDPGSTIITLSPDNWTYPGGYDSEGRPWAVNPANVTRDTPHWQYCDAPEMWFGWYPCVPSPIPTYGVSGGCTVLTPGHPTYGYEYGAHIHAVADTIGLPMELQVGPVCRIAEAWAELSFTGATAERRVFSRPSYGDTGVTTVTTDNVPMAMVLLAGATTYHGEESVPYTTWEPVANAPAGTYEQGKTVVVNVAELLQKMIDLQGSAYDSFALLPSVGVEFLGGPNSGALRGLLGPEPEIAYDATAQEWFVTSCEYTSLAWETYALTAPVVTAIWPDSVIGRHVVPLAWPVMD